VIAEALDTDAANPDARYTNPGRTDIQHKKPRYDPSLHREGWVSGCSAALQRRDCGPPKHPARGSGGPSSTRGYQARYRGRSYGGRSSGGPPEDPTRVAATANSTVEGEEASNSIPTDSRLIFYHYCNIL
jgi:hypothetical protein